MAKAKQGRRFSTFAKQREKAREATISALVMLETAQPEAAVILLHLAAMHLAEVVPKQRVLSLLQSCVDYSIYDDKKESP